MDEKSKAKKEYRLEKWGKLITECENSGKTIVKWCKENNISIKTYYYRLRKVRENLIENCGLPQIVPIQINRNDDRQKPTNAKIEIKIGETVISVPSGTAARDIDVVIKAVCTVC